MAHIKFRDSKGFFEKRGFLIALAVCLIAVAASSYSAVRKLTAQPQTDSSAAISEVGSVVTDVAGIKSDVKDDRVSSAPHTSSPAASQKQSSAASSDPDSDEGAPFFVLPVGGKVIKNFDDDNLQYSETYRDWRLHLGVDIAADKGTAVLSAADGTVIDIYEDALLGTVVKIDHGAGLIAYYCGVNKKPSVTVGQAVEAGVQLGVIDEIPCESVEEAHLHFYMEQDGKKVSPLDRMNMMK